MKCKHCGADNDELFKFCGVCGVPLSKPVEEIPHPDERNTMRKWEYCAVVGLAKEGRHLNPYHPAVWYFTPEGYKIAEIKATERDTVACEIAQLGNEGWEMVAPVNLFERAPGGTFGMMVTGSAAILFKRPKSD